MRHRTLSLAPGPPAFWWQENRCSAARLLAAFGGLYGAVAARRMRQPGFRSKLPVLCIGNLVVGGAGKTPVALALAKRLIAAGEAPWFLSRGYKSAAEHRPPFLVDPQKHLAQEVGDEALLLAAVAPTLVSADRVAAARLAESTGASLLILDDGLQNPALAKDLRLVVIDAGAGVGNGLCLPAGPLRAPLEPQLAFASAVLIIGEGAPGEKLARQAQAFDKPVYGARLMIPVGERAALVGRPVFAFAGIGRPAKFFASLREAAADVIGTAAFPDHYAYRPDDVMRLQHAAQEAGALLVTTEKDFARLRPLALFIDPALPVPMPIAIEVDFPDAVEIEALIWEVVQRVRATSSI